MRGKESKGPKRASTYPCKKPFIVNLRNREDSPVLPSTGEICEGRGSLSVTRHRSYFARIIALTPVNTKRLQCFQCGFVGHGSLTYRSKAVFNILYIIASDRPHINHHSYLFWKTFQADVLPFITIDRPLPRLDLTPPNNNTDFLKSPNLYEPGSFHVAHRDSWGFASFPETTVIADESTWYTRMKRCVNIF